MHCSGYIITRYTFHGWSRVFNMNWPVCVRGSDNRSKDFKCYFYCWKTNFFVIIIQLQEDFISNSCSCFNRCIIYHFTLLTINQSNIQNPIRGFPSITFLPLSVYHQWRLFNLNKLDSIILHPYDYILHCSEYIITKYVLLGWSRVFNMNWTICVHGSGNRSKDFRFFFYCCVLNSQLIEDFLSKSCSWFYSCIICHLTLLTINHSNI